MSSYSTEKCEKSKHSTKKLGDYAQPTKEHHKMTCVKNICATFTAALLLGLAACEPKPRELNLAEVSPMDAQQLFDLQNQVGERKCGLKVAGVINIPVDSTSLNYSLYPVYHDDGVAHYFVTANANQHSLDFYDLDKRQLAKRVRLAKKGPEGVPDLRYFYVKNLDSIFILPRNSGQLFLVNAEGRQLKKTNIDELTPGQEFGHSLMSPIIMRDSFLIVPKTVSEDDLKAVGTSTVAAINIHSGKVVEYDLKFPAAFAGKIAPLGSRRPRLALVENTINVRFGMLSTIYQYDIPSRKISIFSLKSKHQAKAITLTPYVNFNQMMDKEGEKNDFEIASYQNLVYDPYQQVYYSIFVNGIAMINENTGQKNDLDDKPISIIIADRNFNYLGETLLKEHQHFRNFLATRDGLIISNAHFKNPNNKEDVLSFTLYKLDCE